MEFTSDSWSLYQGWLAPLPAIAARAILVTAIARGAILVAAIARGAITSHSKCLHCNIFSLCAWRVTRAPNTSLLVPPALTSLHTSVARRTCFATHPILIPHKFYRAFEKK